MLILQVGYNSVKVRGSKSEMKLLRQYLSVQSENSYFNRRRKKKWDTTIKFFGWISKRFAYGLLGQVIYFLKEHEIKYQLESSRKRPPVLDSDRLGGATLYGYEVRACNGWFTRGGSGIIWGAAGSGKTEMICAIANQMLKRKFASRVLMVVDGLDLLEQGAERLHLRLGLKIGRITKQIGTVRNVTISTIQTIDALIRRKDKDLLAYLKTVDFLVYDEVHLGQSARAVRLVKNCNAKYRLGVSARPLRINYDQYKTKDLRLMKADDARVLATIGPVVRRISSSVLIRLGKLARPRIYLYPLGYEEWMREHSSTEKMSWPTARKELIIENSVIHNISRRQALRAAKAGQTTLVIAGGSRKLGLNIYNELRDANLNVVYLHGGIEKGFRNVSRLKMSSNKLEACVATTIYDEGIDIKNLRQLILAYGGLSPIKNEQRLGRGLRNKLGTNDAVVVDFMSYGNKHLRKHSYARLKMYLEEDAYDVYLVGKRHPPYVVRLVGKKKIVDHLPGKKLFKQLKRGTPNNGGKYPKADYRKSEGTVAA